METPADAPNEPTNPSATEAGAGDMPGTNPATDPPQATEATEATGPSGLRLAVTSIGAFLAIVAIGGLIGLTSGAGVDDAMAAAASIDIPSDDAGDSDIAALDTASLDTEVLDTGVLDTTVIESPVIESAVIESEVAGTTESASPATTAPAVAEAEAVELTADDVTVNEPVTVVQGVTELALPLVDDNDAATESAPSTGPDPTSIEFLELPKAVYDRFTLQTGDSFAINIAANDKIGGVLQSVTLTGLGELAPGFVLNLDGTVSGVASECGVWKAQYALNSTNPAVGTSWIDITVSGCSDT